MTNEVRNERIRFAIAIGIYGAIVVVALIIDSYLTYIGR